MIDIDPTDGTPTDGTPTDGAAIDPRTAAPPEHTLTGPEADPPTPLIAFHGSEALKSFYVARARAHREADQIVAGQYWDPTGPNNEYQGCAVGCMIHSSEHADYPDLLGVPEVLARLQDAVFEGLPSDDRTAFVVDFLEAIPVGADLSLVWHHVAAPMMERCIGYVGEGDEAWRVEARDAVAGVHDLHARAAGGGNVTHEEWAAAWDAAWDAARAAARAAAWAAAGDAARDAAGDAGDAARAAEYRAIRDDLLTALRTAPTI